MYRRQKGHLLFNKGFARLLDIHNVQMTSQKLYLNFY